MSMVLAMMSVGSARETGVDLVQRQIPFHLQEALCDM